MKDWEGFQHIRLLPICALRIRSRACGGRRGTFSRSTPRSRAGRRGMPRPSTRSTTLTFAWPSGCWSQPTATGRQVDLEGQPREGEPAGAERVSPWVCGVILPSQSPVSPVAGCGGRRVKLSNSTWPAFFARVQVSLSAVSLRRRWTGALNRCVRCLKKRCSRMRARARRACNRALCTRDRAAVLTRQALCRRLAVLAGEL